MTTGWNGKPAAGGHVFVVTHRPPTGWEYADTAEGDNHARGHAKSSAPPRRPSLDVHSY